MALECKYGPVRGEGPAGWVRGELREGISLLQLSRRCRLKLINWLAGDAR